MCNRTPAGDTRTPLVPFTVGRLPLWLGATSRHHVEAGAALVDRDHQHRRPGTETGHSPLVRSLTAPLARPTMTALTTIRMCCPYHQAQPLTALVLAVTASPHGLAASSYGCEYSVPAAEYACRAGGGTPG